MEQKPPPLRFVVPDQSMKESESAVFLMVKVDLDLPPMTTSSMIYQDELSLPIVVKIDVLIPFVVTPEIGGMVV